MTGWIHIKDDPLSHYRAAEKRDDTQWPPKFHKLIVKLRDSDNEIAFVDARRLGRIRLIDHHDGHDLRNVSPLKENGPDPVIEPIKLEWLQNQLKARKVPVKAWLLDQSAIAGIGNWVGDEILFHARLHPECYTQNLGESHVADLHKAILEVTKTAVETDADSSKFPANWLMLHRWGKGKGTKNNKLPTGEQVEFLKVGGRTSAFVRALQRYVGPMAGDMTATPKVGKGPKVKKGESEGERVEDGSELLSKRRGKRSAMASGVLDDGGEESTKPKTPKHESELPRLPKRTKTAPNPTTQDSWAGPEEAKPSLRRSGRKK